MFFVKANAQRDKNQKFYLAALFPVTKGRRQSTDQQERTEYILVHAGNGSHAPSRQDRPVSALRRLKQEKAH